MASYVGSLHPRKADLSDEQISTLYIRVRKWEEDNHPGELTRHPQMAAWIFAATALGLLLSSGGGLDNIAPIILLGLPVVSFALYFYFNNRLENWQHKRDLHEAYLVEEMLAKVD